MAGDEKLIPLSAAALAASGFDYVALGHIHKPQILIRDQAAFSGALEPLTGMIQGNMDIWRDD